jgi:translation initiation factor IF-2
VKIVFGGVGGINEGDANLALASGAILMGFNVRADATARVLIIIFKIDVSPAAILENTSSSLEACCAALCLNLLLSSLCSARSLAARSLVTTIKSSPAFGVPDKPKISTGVEGPGGVGGINEGDANLALASGAILMGFNVRADATARKLILEKEIDLHYYSVYA